MVGVRPEEMRSVRPSRSWRYRRPYCRCRPSRRDGSCRGARLRTPEGRRRCPTRRGPSPRFSARLRCLQCRSRPGRSLTSPDADAFGSDHDEIRRCVHGRRCHRCRWRRKARPRAGSGRCVSVYSRIPAAVIDGAMPAGIRAGPENRVGGLGRIAVLAEEIRREIADARIGRSRQRSTRSGRLRDVDAFQPVVADSAREVGQVRGRRHSRSAGRLPARRSVCGRSPASSRRGPCPPPLDRSLRGSRRLPAP